MSTSLFQRVVAAHRHHIRRCNHCFQSSTAPEPGFGLLFDIDGVLIRGKKPILAAKRAFQNKLLNGNGKFRVPTVFVTNAGNALAKTKAEQLSDILDIEITSDPVMMSHSPLRMFEEYHDKCVLLSGQGPVEEIAKKIGFTNTVTIEEIREAYPNLDMVDHQRRPKTVPNNAHKNIPKIEAIVLFGEPVRWETNLQLLIDVLLTHGVLENPVCEFANNEHHLPILACNMDLLWMSDSHMPRFGHGTFLHCLESVYQKLVGRPLTYTALMGKPSEITYYYAEKLIMRQAASMGLKLPIKTLYAIGDNPMADIYGANLYNKRLKESQQLEQRKVVNEPHSPAHPSSLRKVHPSTRSLTTSAALGQDSDVTSQSRSVLSQRQVETCESILVCTGVYSPLPGGSSYQIPPVFHGPRDMEFDVSLCMPSHITNDVDSALDYIFERESFHSQVSS
ncbi:haloacid dehalogenase-like hydrolase domain-containing 5 [Clavelina lepadiformis]|uniref:haloacid dehalogenase-like hydrolase domain-containing 5 n=1 Tax=Clavelina lepadiformis TaxID=159417 RepID=UPI00404124A6